MRLAPYGYQRRDSQSESRRIAGPPAATDRSMPALPAGTPNAINALFTTRGKGGRLEDESFHNGEAVKKTFDAVAFMRKRREELSRAYAGLTAEQIEERIQQSLKNDPLWRKPPQGKVTRKGT
jgi:hypothetical protein